MAEGYDPAEMLAKLTAGLSVGDVIQKAQEFQAADNHKQAIEYYEKV